MPTLRGTPPRGPGVDNLTAQANTPERVAPALGQAISGRWFYRGKMNPRAIVIALLTMITAVTGYTVITGIDEFPLDPSTANIVTVQDR